VLELREQTAARWRASAYIGAETRNSGFGLCASARATSNTATQALSPSRDAFAIGRQDNELRGENPRALTSGRS
jgi:hypothetical protein